MFAFRRLLAIALILFSPFSIGAISALKEYRLAIASNFSAIDFNTYNPFGKPERNGITLALEEMAPLMAKLGIELKVLELDYGNDVLGVTALIKKAAADPKVLAVIGYDRSEFALLAGPVHQSLKLPMVTHSATADRLGTMGDFVHSTTFDNTYQGEMLARFAFDKLKSRKTLMIVAADCAYCQDLARAFAGQFQGLGGTVLPTLSVLKDEADYSKIVVGLNPDSFDVVFVPNHEGTSARVMKTLLKHGMDKAPFIGGDGWGYLGGDFFSGIPQTKFRGYYVSPWRKEVPTLASQSFVAKYEARFGIEPTYTAAIVYDTIRYVASAIQYSKRIDRLSLETQLSKIGQFDGVTGRVIFRRNRAPKRTMLLTEVDRAGFQLKEVMDPK